MTVQEYAVKLRSNISKIIKGKDDKIDLVIMALLSGGHVLLDDVPGRARQFSQRHSQEALTQAFQEYSLPPTCYRPILPVSTFSI